MKTDRLDQGSSTFSFMSGKAELYNLKDDPSEHRDLARSEPRTRRATLGQTESMAARHECNHAAAKREVS
ncbi:MAG: hypothetical protein ACKVHE_01510 [Planctomycetales bacterium]